MIREGADTFGPFRVLPDPCDICRRDEVISIQYIDEPQLPAGVKLEDTIGKKWPRAYGVTCGCYAKFHRQVAHIADKIKARA